MAEDRGFTEADWKLFRKKIADWQEAYMEKLIGEYVELLSTGGDASERFWQLERRIRKDKRDAGVSVEMRRSRMVGNIEQLLAEGAITPEDLEGFSDTLKAEIARFLEWRERF